MGQPAPQPPAAAKGGPFGDLKSTISAIVAFAGFLAGIVGTFVIPPAFNQDLNQDIGATSGIVALGRFIVGLIVAVAMFPILRLAQRRYFGYWAAAAVLSTIGGFLLYSQLAGDEVRYVHRIDLPSANVHIVYVMSDELAPSGSQFVDDYKKQNGISPSDNTIYLHFNSLSEGIYYAWDRDTVFARERIFAMQYLGLIAIFSCVLIFSAQAVRCALLPA